MNIVDSLLAAFLIIWFIVVRKVFNLFSNRNERNYFNYLFLKGNYWVYNVKGSVQFIDNSTNATNSTFDLNRNETIHSVYCDRLTYELSFWVITTVHMIIGLSCLLFCCSVCFTICLSPKK